MSRFSIDFAGCVGMLLLTFVQPSFAEVSFDDINPDQSTHDATDPDSASGGRVNGLALTPGDNQVGYAASEWGGLYKTMDGGRTWNFLPGHVPNITYRVAVDPTNANRIYATSWYDGRTESRAGISVSLDAGVTWNHAGPAPAGFCPEDQRTRPSAFGVAIDPDDPSEVYVGTNCGLAVSNDSGANWIWIDPTPDDPPNRVWDVVVHHNGTVDICGEDGHFRRMPGAVDWTSGVGLPSGVCSIAASPHERSVLFVTVGQDIYESSDGGATWTELGTPDSRRQGRIPFLVINERSSTTFDLWYGDVHLFRGACVSNQGPTRCPMATVGSLPDPPLPTPPAGWAGPFTRDVGGHDDVGHLAFDTTAEINACPLLFSSDGGVYYNTRTQHPSCQTPQWEQPDRTPHALWHWSFGAATDDITGQTILVTGSQDDGTHGTVDAAAALPAWAARECCDIFDVEVDENYSLYTFCCASAEHRETRLNRRNPDLTGGGNIPSDSYPESGLIPSFRFPGVIDRFAVNSYALITRDCTPAENGCPDGSTGDGGVFITTNVGADPIAWVELGGTSEPDSQRACAVKAAAGAPGVTVFYVQVDNCGGDNSVTTDGELWRFDFAGDPNATWTRIDTNLPSGGIGIFDVDPTNANRLFASNIRADGPHMMRSNDGGATWDPDPGLDQMMTGDGTFRYRPTAFKRFTTGFGVVAQPTLIQFDATDPAIIIAGAETAGLFLSTDNGANWSLINDPVDPVGSSLPHLPGPRKAYFQRVDDLNRLIYVSTRGRGLWRVDLRLPPYRFSYSAKIVCGRQPDPDNFRLIRGEYGTAINILNPLPASARFRKILSLTFPPDEQAPGEVTKIADDLLSRYQALEVDCEDIRRRLFPNGFPQDYIKGFVTIELTESLTVTAVYTSGSVPQRQGPCCSTTAMGEHSSIDVEQIAERKIKAPDRDTPTGLPDLVPEEPFPGPPPDDLIFLPQHYCFAPAALAPHVAQQVRVRIRNIGAEQADASNVTVTFESGETGLDLASDTQAIPLLNPGLATTRDFPIPDGCYFNSNAGGAVGTLSPCSFRIAVDQAPEQVSESNETNNISAGSCLGASG